MVFSSHVWEIFDVGTHSVSACRYCGRRQEENEDDPLECVSKQRKVVLNRAWKIRGEVARARASGPQPLCYECGHSVLDDEACECICC